MFKIKNGIEKLIKYSKIIFRFKILEIIFIVQYFNYFYGV